MFNSGADQSADADGNVDGYRYWSPVDAVTTDESRYGVRDLAGNVSEWTATWDSHPDYPDKRVPMKRGASFANQENFEMTVRRSANTADDANLSTGFRTARSEPPLPVGSPPQTPSAPETVEGVAPAAKSTDAESMPAETGAETAEKKDASTESEAPSPKTDS